MTTSAPMAAWLVLQQVKILRDEVRASLESQDPVRFISDDIRMERYSLLLREARECHPDDLELIRMGEMPDRVVQWYGRSSDPHAQALASKRLLDRVMQLANRLEFLQLPLGSHQSPGTVTIWPDVNGRLIELQKELPLAKDATDFQRVGLGCRELLISLAQKVYDPEQHTTPDGVPLRKADSKGMLDAFVAAKLSGGSNEQARRFVKSSIQLADAVVHRNTANFLDGALCVRATEAVVNVVSIVADRRDT